MVNDPHQVRLAEAHAQANDTSGIRGIDRSHRTCATTSRRLASRRHRVIIRRVSRKRRLPVVQSPQGGDATDELVRSPWQWVGFGAGAIFVAWLPLSAAALALAARISRRWDVGDEPQLARAGLAIGAIYTVAIALGAICGGFLTGRWGGAGVGVREATLAGLTAAAVATALSFASFGFAPRSFLVAVVAVPMAALGGKLGKRGR
jgi:hypothetical protein